ncbi:PREDICTED: immunoglobulin superfamily member 1-like [Gekko japonicus]|uniref:immunoglobulin superfamily member 1-like n=1 Tax=Gekko japonicus TaxID=146911 RepID=UPI00074FDFC9|nr:PREDICTED: immunoglobulin superfamily member 1-like [Gekko japonicus]
MPEREPYGQSVAHRRFSSMRFSVAITFLELPYPKPSVSISSSEVVTQGGNITIHCKNESPPQAEFSLNKQEGSSLHRLCIKKAEQNEVIFTISSAHQSNAGIYRCIYCLKINAAYEKCSDYSDEVHINVRDPKLAKPSIKVRHRGPLASGLNVTIECQGPGNGLNFSLYESKVLRASQVTQPNGDRAEFSFFIERMEKATSYACQYNRKENPFVWSEPSETVELVGRDKDSGLKLFIYLSQSKQCILSYFPFIPLETFISADDDGPIYNSHNDGVTYAVLNQHSLKTERAAVPGRAPETCVYASVAKDSIREER